MFKRGAGKSGKGVPNFTFGHYGGRPVWMQVAEVMEDGRWYTRPVLRQRLAHVPYDTIKMILVRMHKERVVERATLDGVDPDPYKRGYRHAEVWFAWRLTDLGRDRLHWWRECYGLVG